MALSLETVIDRQITGDIPELGITATAALVMLQQEMADLVEDQADQFIIGALGDVLRVEVQPPVLVHTERAQSLTLDGNKREYGTRRCWPPSAGVQSSLG